MAVGGLETCRGARAVHSVFALLSPHCRPIALSVPLGTGRATRGSAAPLLFLATLDLYVIGIEPADL